MRNLANFGFAPLILAIAFFAPLLAPPIGPWGTAGQAVAKVVCGGVDEKGNWVGDCGYKKAVSKGKPAQLKCPAGSFLDIKGQVLHFMKSAECWKCPDGYRRSAANVEKDNACLIDAHIDYARATGHGSVQCKFGGPPTMFLDPRNGGECWSCPEGYHRTVYPVTKGDSACRVGLSKKWAAATYKGKQCPDGAFLDPRNGGECWSCPAGFRRTALAVTHAHACTKGVGITYSKAQMVKKVGCPIGSFFDLIDGGTCWACPAYYTRDLTNVKGPKACRSLGFEWQSPDYPEPGLLNMAGVGPMAVAIAKDSAKVNAFLTAALTATASKGKKPTAGQVETTTLEAWQTMIENPQSSPAFNAMMFYVLEDAIANPDTAAKKAMVDGFSDYIVKRRTFIAQDALNAYDAWYKTDQWKRTHDASLQQAGMGSLFDYGTVPPDFQKLTQKAMQQSGLAPAAAATMLALTGVAHGIAASSPEAFDFVSKFALGVAQKSSTTLKMVDATAGTTDLIGPTKEMITHSFKIAGKSFNVVGSSSSKIASLVAASAGPITIITTAAQLAYMAIDQFIKIERARPRLLAALDKAKKSLSLKDLQDMGPAQHIYFWALATNNQALQQNTKSVQAALKAGYDKFYGKGASSAPLAWAQVPGNAHDVAVASDGTAWVIGMDKVPGGYSIWHRAPRARSWTKVAGGATRIAVAGTRVFVINEAGMVFQREGNTWAQRGNPGAKDIGASNAAIYIVGGKKVAGGYEIMQWKGGGTWKKYPGGAVRVDVDAEGQPWVVNEQGTIFALLKGKWQVFSGKGKDIGIFEFGAPVVIGTDDQVWSFDKGANKWMPTKRPGSAVAVAPDKKVWYIGEKNEIYAQK